MTKLLFREIEQVQKKSRLRLSGRVTHAIGLLIESNGPSCFVGEVCYVYGKNKEPLPYEVVGFKDQKVLLMSLTDVAEVTPGAEVYPTGEPHRVAVSGSLCGRVLDGLGHPIDGKGPVVAEQYYSVMARAPTPLVRKNIRERFETKIKAIDGLCTIGKGQRMGVFSGPGVGKSTLMGMLCRSSKAEVNIIALIGERGREVKEFIEQELSPEVLAKSIVIAATSDQGALCRSKGAHVATAIAEYFRDQGRDVLLVMDSLSRYAMALREIGLAVGEPLATRGYTPSVFALLPKLLERAGNGQQGSITGIYTVLCEEDNDPIALHVRSLLDGHLQLSEKLAARHHFPPIDILQSLSRLMPHITTPQQLLHAARIRELLHVYAEAEDLIHLGAYVPGSNAKIDEAVSKYEEISRFLQQRSQSAFCFEEMLKNLRKI